MKFNRLNTNTLRFSADKRLKDLECQNQDVIPFAFNSTLSRCGQGHDASCPDPMSSLGLYTESSHSINEICHPTGTIPVKVRVAGLPVHSVAGDRAVPTYPWNKTQNR